MYRVVLCILAVATGARSMDDEMAEMARMLRENCVDETGVDAALIDAVNAGGALTPDPKLQCYTKCFMEIAGMLSEGEVDVDAVVALLPEEMASKHAARIRECGTQRGADDCETAFLTQVCWQKATKEDYFLV